MQGTLPPLPAISFLFVHSFFSVFLAFRGTLSVSSKFSCSSSTGCCPPGDFQSGRPKIPPAGRLHTREGSGHAAPLPAVSRMLTVLFSVSSALPGTMGWNQTDAGRCPKGGNHMRVNVKLPGALSGAKEKLAARLPGVREKLGAWLPGRGGGKGPRKPWSSSAA